jgi:hypothetical protein
VTITLNLPPAVEAGVLAQAQANGKSPEEYLLAVVEEAVLPSGPRLAYELSPEEWVRRFTAWSEGPAHANLPDLSDEAVSRESIYAERGL